MTHIKNLSHKQKRPFQPAKLSKPRDFILPEIIANKQKSRCPLVVEIGAGKGMHALSFAKQNPDKHLIAIERTLNKFDAFFKMTQTQQLPNLTAVHADAIAWIVQAIGPNSLTRIYLLYPNPEQHNSNQQWLNMPFFEFLISRLQIGGEIILATNIEEYMDNAEQQADALWCLPAIRQEVPVNSQRTHFEIKYLARKEKCWQLTMTKPEGYQTRFDEWQAS
ncbi:SAM-dependent methyltransferase [Psychrobacter sp. 2Y5]|uniref:SAM-dependent methyltransferase n=1 Tax=unclassified Psychrobacter TaxID=196806 RepID=UPI003F479C20